MDGSSDEGSRSNGWQSLPLVRIPRIPLRVLKQVLSMFFSANGVGFALVEEELPNVSVLMRCAMSCLLCGMADEDSACSFHPGRLFLSHNLGAHGDYNDAYIWSCCGRYAESSVDANGCDARPPHSPGCVIQQQHIFVAAIHLCCSGKGRDLALKTAAALKDSGFLAEVS